MGGGLESRCVGSVCGADGAARPERGVDHPPHLALRLKKE